jgi:hypothetical protein
MRRRAMPEATREREGREDGERMRTTQRPADARAAGEPDREVENYRDEYDFEKRSLDVAELDQRS